MTKVTDLAKAEKRGLEIPSRKITGKSTTNVAKVDARTGIATSDAPSREARSEERPSCCLRLIFSNTTIELSTRTPIERARPPKVIALMVWPAALRPRKAVRRESGIESK